MKKLILMLLCAFIVIACSKDKSDEEFDDPNIPVPDPIGTLTGELTSYGTTKSIYPVGTYQSISISGIASTLIFTPHTWAIAPYGQVAGLGNVNKIPKTGWLVAGSGSIEDSPKINVEVGKAYVFALTTKEIYSGLTSQASRMFVRLFIEGWITMDKVGVIGVTAKHQSPFRDPSINKFEVSTTSVKISPSDPEHKLVEVTPFQTWSVKVEGENTGVGIAITDEGNLQIGKFWGEAKKGIHKVRLTSEGFSDIIINVEVI